ncbi:hypothetical protein ACGFX4_39250 [Kitasatospora sp. NPDC048365]|uniref:hypothetical protein n=1 Tax=Kitasatospora sp. NPDC048365 TaxID=3364050 RepID=UPI00372156E5
MPEMCVGSVPVARVRHRGAAALRGCGVDERGEDVLVDRVVGQARHPVAGGLVVAEGQDDFAGDCQVGAFRVEFGSHSPNSVAS